MNLSKKTKRTISLISGASVILIGIGILIYWLFNPYLTSMELFFSLWEWYVLLTGLMIGYNYFKHYQ